jgi:hypothetical protein
MAHLPNHMPVNILISPYAQRINPFHDTNKVTESGVCFSKFGRCERMRFRPVWPTIVPNGDRFKSFEKFAVWDRKPVWPVGRTEKNRRVNFLRAAAKKPGDITCIG